MTISKYKGYTLRNVGISYSIYRPGQNTDTAYPPGYEQGMAAAKRWVNSDIAKGGD